MTFTFITCLLLTQEFISLELKNREDYRNIVVTIGTIISTILTVAFSFIVLGLQHFIPNYNPKFHQYIFANPDIIMSYTLLTLMVLLTFALLFFLPEMQFINMIFFFCLFSFPLLYYNFYSISNLIRINPLIDIIQKKLVKVLSSNISSPLENETMIDEVNKDMDYLLTLLVKEGNSSRMESSEHGEKAISNILSTSYINQMVGFKITEHLLESSVKSIKFEECNNLVPMVLKIMSGKIDLFKPDIARNTIEFKELCIIVIKFNELLTIRVKKDSSNEVLNILYLLEKVSLRIESSSPLVNNVLKDFSKKNNRRKPFLVPWIDFYTA
ncbi:MAG: hypothetical protein P0116_02420 [Candidatus Nitrosocosmicus sp.]|nr:hypothetical protein [Candidatus Nitrosocosmicus sp.]